jgi:hypothetical protein
MIGFCVGSFFELVKMVIFKGEKLAGFEVRQQSVKVELGCYLQSIVISILYMIWVAATATAISSLLSHVFEWKIVV